MIEHGSSPSGAAATIPVEAVRRSSSRRPLFARIGVVALALGGLAVGLWLIADTGFAEVGQAFAKTGWGLALLVLCDAAALSCAGLGWWALLRGFWPGPAILFIRLRYLREAINGLLPVAQVGGDVVGAHMLAARGAPAALAMAGIIADKTVEVLGLLAYTILGFLLLLARTGGGGSLIDGVGLGLLVAGGLLASFLTLQNSRLFGGFERLLLALGERLQWAGLGQMAGLHAALLAIYRQRPGLAGGAALHLLAWVAGAGQTWLALHLMGQPITLGDAVILESLGQAARSAAFVVPGGLGAQEGAYLLIGGALGLPAEFALALSLVKRASQLALGLPMLVSWPFLQRRRPASELAG